MVTMDKIVALCKRRGFVYPSSEIYGGLANAYDYGPLGAELLRNIRNIWWQEFINKREDIVGLDTQIILHPQTWVASGHVGSFSDPLVEDVISHKRYRADHIIEDWLKKPKNEAKKVVVEDLSVEEMGRFIELNNIKSPDGNKLTQPKKFNLLFETFLGVVTGEKSKVYLRGETAQGIFSQFRNVLDTTRVKLPFGIGQVGKSFRNEITTGQFIFRTFELEQAEIEYFFDPDATDWKKLFESLKESMWSFVTKTLGIKEKNLAWRKHTDKERSHYSKETYDLDYKFPFGFKELWGIAYRTDYDLQQHAKLSGKDLNYFDPVKNKKFIPHVIEPAVGLNRIFLMLITDAFREEEVEGKTRTYLKLSPRVAPVKVAVFPLQKDAKLKEVAKKIFNELKNFFTVEFDDAGNIGKMYRRQDEIGTPYCITVDFESLQDNKVTVRERDTMKQERVLISEIYQYLLEKLKVSLF